MAKGARSFQGFCPLCGRHIPTDRYVGGRAVCACGWRDESANAIANERLERQASLGLIAVSVFFALFLGHMFAWGSHALSIPGLKIGQWTGMLSSSGYRELAKACLDLGKNAAAERAYFDMYRSARDVEGLALLGSLQAREGKAQPALSSYSAYFQAGGRDANAMVAYAKLLEGAGQVDEALKRYDEAAANSNLLPVSATTGAVRLLISQRRLEEAYMRVLAFHASAENAKGYLNSERNNLEAWLGPKAVAQIQARVGQQARAALGLPPGRG